MGAAPSAPAPAPQITLSEPSSLNKGDIVEGFGVTVTGPPSVTPGQYFETKAMGNWRSGAGAVWALNGVPNVGCRNPGCGFIAPNSGTANITYTVEGQVGRLSIPVIGGPAPAPAAPRPGPITVTGPSSVKVGEYFEVKAMGNWTNASGAVWAMNGVPNAGCRNPGCGFTAPRTAGTANITYTVEGGVGSLTIPVIDPNPLPPNIPRYSGACYNINEFKPYDNSVRYIPGIPVQRSDGTLWVSKNINGAAGYAPTLDNSIFVPYDAKACGQDAPPVPPPPPPPPPPAFTQSLYANIKPPPGCSDGRYDSPAYGAIRLYTSAECTAKNGVWSVNGECIKKTGGSYSWDCRNQNNPPAPAATTTAMVQAATQAAIALPPKLPPPPSACTTISGTTVYQHCDATGWSQPLWAPGTYTWGTDYPTDASFINVPAGVTAVLVQNGNTNNEGVTIRGPGSQNFCAIGGYNDNTWKIILTTECSKPIAVPAICPFYEAGPVVSKAFAVTPVGPNSIWARNGGWCRADTNAPPESTGAQWIWWQAGGGWNGTSAESGTNHIFSKTFTNRGAPYKTNVYGAFDDYGTLYFPGNQSVTLDTQATCALLAQPVTVPSGSFKVIVLNRNSGGPGGFWLYFQDSTGAYNVTDATWDYNGKVAVKETTCANPPPVLQPLPIPGPACTNNICNSFQIQNTVNATASGSSPSWITLVGPSCVLTGKKFDVQALGNWINATGAVWAMNGQVNAGCKGPGCSFNAPNDQGTVNITYTLNGVVGTLSIQVIDPNMCAAPAPSNQGTPAYTPATIPLSVLKGMFTSAGCNPAKLTEGDMTVKYWRNLPSIASIQNDMNAYGSGLANGTATYDQAEFCQPSAASAGCACNPINIKNTAKGKGSNPSYITLEGPSCVGVSGSFTVNATGDWVTTTGGTWSLNGVAANCTGTSCRFTAPSSRGDIIVSYTLNGVNCILSVQVIDPTNCSPLIPTNSSWVPSSSLFNLGTFTGGPSSTIVNSQKVAVVAASLGLTSYTSLPKNMAAVGAAALNFATPVNGTLNVTNVNTAAFDNAAAQCAKLTFSDLQELNRDVTSTDTSCGWIQFGKTGSGVAILGTNSQPIGPMPANIPAGSKYFSPLLTSSAKSISDNWQAAVTCSGSGDQTKCIAEGFMESKAAPKREGFEAMGKYASVDTQFATPFLNQTPMPSSTPISRDRFMQVDGNAGTMAATLYQESQKGMSNPGLGTKSSYAIFDKKTDNVTGVDTGAWEAWETSFQSFQPVGNDVFPRQSRDIPVVYGSVEKYDFCSEMNDQTIISEDTIGCLQRDWIRKGGAPTDARYPTTALLGMCYGKIKGALTEGFRMRR